MGKGGSWVQLLILRILYETPLHGYALNERLNSLQAGRRPIKSGSMYTILRRMENEGLLESTWDEESSRINKRVYTLSKYGKIRLNEGRTLVEHQLDIFNEMNQFYDKHFKKSESNDQI